MHGPTGIFWASLTPFSLRVGYSGPLLAEGRRRRLAGTGWGSVTLSLRTTPHPLHTIFANILGAFLSETTMRPPNPRTGGAVPDAVVIGGVGAPYVNSGEVDIRDKSESQFRVKQRLIVLNMI
jgi:hypothetical protein